MCGRKVRRRGRGGRMWKRGRVVVFIPGGVVCEVVTGHDGW